jgi:hypothetical protein
MQQYYTESACTGHDAKVENVIKRFRAAYPNAYDRPDKSVRLWLGRVGPGAPVYTQHAHPTKLVHPADDKPRSGRPPLESRVSDSDIRKCVDALKAGVRVGKQRKAFRLGRGLLDCSVFRDTAEKYQFSWEQLLLVLTRAEPKLIKSVEVTKLTWRPATIRQRKQVAALRLQQLAKDPTEYKRIFILDSSHKWHSQLLELRVAVVTHKDNDLSAYSVDDPRLGDTNCYKSCRYDWLIMTNPAGGVSPLYWVRGTVGEKVHKVSR